MAAAAHGARRDFINTARVMGTRHTEHTPPRSIYVKCENSQNHGVMTKVSGREGRRPGRGGGPVPPLHCLAPLPHLLLAFSPPAPGPSSLGSWQRPRFLQGSCLTGRGLFEPDFRVEFFSLKIERNWLSSS